MRKLLITSFILCFTKLTMALPNDHINNYEQLDTIIPSYISDLGNGFTFELKINMALGTHGRGLGLNAITTYTKSKGSVSAGLGSTYYLSEMGTGKSGLEIRIFGGGMANLGKGWSMGYYHTKFISGETSQHLGNVITSYKDWSFTFENDMIGDNGDRYRSHASVLSYKDMSLGLNLFTSDPAKDKGLRRIIEDDGAYGTYLLSSNGDDPDKYRLGVFYFRYKIFRLGTNSEYIRHWTQNRLIHDSTRSPQFAMRDRKWSLYGGIYTYNPFTAW
jgi:hypothetical protein